MEVRHAVVPAGGRGTRMEPVTRAVPKELLPLGVTPVIDLVLDELAAAGFTEVVVVCAPDKPALREYLGDRVRVIDQPQPRGLGDAVLCAAEVVGDRPFAVALPDALVAHDVLPMLLERALDGAVALEEVPAERASAYGIATVDGDGVITHIEEKPPRPASRLAVAARYVLPPATFEVLRRVPPGHGGEVQLTDALARLVHDGVRLAGVVTTGARRDVGSPEGYAAAFVDAVRGAAGDR
jgi:UTP-glucose-1-phosphate uridylyltransferase